MSFESDGISRRSFVQRAAIGGASLALGAELQGSVAEARPIANTATMMNVPFGARPTVRVGIVGVGNRGTTLLANILNIDNVEVSAVCDLLSENVARAQKMAVDAKRPAPRGFSNGELDFKNLHQLDLDIVYIATPWHWHVPMAVDAMKNGKHAAVEVPAATTIKECWQLVEISERTRKHCVLLENCCYGEFEMMVLQMVRDGVFGEITHGEAAYLHDLRALLVSAESEGLWRRFEHTKRNGNLYPTHGLGPMANYMGINRGDRFDHMVSLSSREASLSEYVKARFPDGNPRRREKYICGDMSTSIIKTVKGRTILLQHDVVSPRPYSRNNSIMGTKGIFADFPPRVFVDAADGKDSHGAEKWQDVDSFKEKYQHPLWKTTGDLARRMGGHGGMDFIMNFRLMDCLKRGLVPDIDVYDAVSWSAPGPLSEMSVSKRGAPQDFPDFTNGMWNKRESQGFAL